MLVVLQTKSNRARAQRIQLRVNQVAQFGRSDWADYSFEDPAMSELHFEFSCKPDGCYVRNLSEGKATTVNGEEIQEAHVRTGDEIRAGETSFEVTIEGDVNPAPEPESDPAPIAQATVAAAAGLAGLAATCAYLELSKDVQSLSESTTSAEELIEKLIGKEQFLDALRIRAFLLPRREAVWWGCLCVREVADAPLDADQAAALAAAEAWVADPTEELRRDAEAKSNNVGSRGPGGMLAISAFWSEGTIGAADSPPVPADDRLVCQGVTGALITAAYAGDASLAEDRLTAFLQKGQDAADGKIPLPAKPE